MKSDDKYLKELRLAKVIMTEWVKEKQRNWEGIMKDDKWIKRWLVSSSSSDGNHTVGQDAEENYGCSCRGWTMHVKRLCPKHDVLLIKRVMLNEKTATWCPVCAKHVEPRIERPDCSHIRTVKGGGGRTLAEATLDIMNGRL